MDVIGHHDPSVQKVSLAIEMEQCILNNLSDAVVSQIATSIPLIKVSVDALATFKVIFFFGQRTDFLPPYIERFLRD